MTFKQTISFIILFFLLSRCSALIYAVRGPKYEGKFEEQYYLPMLENQYFYVHVDRTEDFKDSIRVSGNDTTRITRNYSKHSYIFLRYDKDGKIRVKGIDRDTALEQLPAYEDIDALPVTNELFYVIKDSLIRYEVYHDSYNGYNLYKSRVYEDSIVDWQVGISKLFLKTYKRVKG